MLVHLRVQNFATVDSLELEPHNGLTVISGETGAGKSILIDALSLSLGERADASVVRAGCDRAEVQATFDVSQSQQVLAWLQARELDEGEECDLRRTIRTDGRSRAYINGRPANVSDVRELGELLINIHSQHEHQALLKKDHQRNLLDRFAGATDLAATCRDNWKLWQKAKQTHEQALQQAQEADERQTLLRFQLDELDAFAPEENEIETLEQEQKRLANAEQLIHLCQRSLAQLYEQDDSNINQQLSVVSHDLTDACQEDAALNEVLQSIESARVQVEAAADDLRSYLDRLELDPERLVQVQTRLSDAYTLARKHRVRPEELWQRHQQLQQEAGTLADMDGHLASLEKAEQRAKKAFEKIATNLSQKRHKKAAELANGVQKHLTALSMKGAKLNIDLTPCAPCADGLEQTEILFTANAGQPLKPLSKVASGGELSRVSLAIQVICAQTLTAPCLVFDEVDVGIGGGVAEIVGRLLRQLGLHAQVLCITHQPQVAALGNHHWHVHKTQQKNSTRTQILSLETQQRVREVARMLGGVEITDSTLNHAQEMLERSQVG